MVSYTLSILPSTPRDKYESSTRKDQCCTKELFTLGRVENNDDFLPINLLIVQKRTTKRTEEYKFQTQYIHFGSRIHLVPIRS